MTAKLKLAAYVILVILAICFARGFYSNYSKVKPLDLDQAADTSPQSPPAPKADSTNQAPPVPAQTNTADLSATNSAPTNDLASSNAVTQSAAPTNMAAAGTPPAKPASSAAANANVPQNKHGNPVAYLAAFVGAMIGLGLLVAYDVTHYLGSRTVDVLFDDDGAGERDPEYERAEEAWVNGKPLEAIEMMRDYLKKNPREQHVALRIAEIYEKDLRNYVAASLEYEEVLKKRLRPERWGWAAIHLCNIYAKLGRQDKMRELLERIARDYPQTGAAKKARRNLGLPEPEEAAAPAAEPEEPAQSAEVQDENGVPVFDLDEAIASTEEEAPPPPPEAQPEAPPPADASKPKLPPGFRPKQ